MDYLDFELEIDAGTGREYPVRVINSPAGQARETMHFPFGELELENKLQALQIALLRTGGQRRLMLSPEQQTVQDFGRALFDALLTGEVRVRYDVSLRDATLQKHGLRLKLHVNTPEMAVLPWEFLYDPRRADPICLSRDTPIVRYLELPQPIQPLTVTRPLRILGMVASPSDLPRLNVALEKQRVEAALRSLQKRGIINITWLEGQTWQDLHQMLRVSDWHIFHFIGHGGFDKVLDEGYIALADEHGATHRFSATQLGRLLANACDNSLRLALLNACESAMGSERDLFSSTASIVVRRGIPAVLAMQYPITDRAAIEFARTFYESLAVGLPVDAAVVESRVAISLAVHNTVEWGTPVLYMRSPDGILFKLQEEEARDREKKVTSDPLVSYGAQTIVNNAYRASGIERSITRQLFEPEMLLIPAGEFLMGSVLWKDKDAQDDEQPQHILYVPDYFIAKTPVTNAQYMMFVQTTGYTAPQHWRNGIIPLGKEFHPVVYVTWDDAMAYCRWLTDATGRLYTLPSEAEWEKAARGIDGRLYPWGDVFDISKCDVKESGVGDTVPVDRYLQGASPYGVLDMAGNVWEWTRSQYGPYPYDSSKGREDVQSSAVRVIRGGAFYDIEWYARCASRDVRTPYHRSATEGFRVVVMADAI